MTDEKKPITIEFAPGAFDQFDGTQEELNEIIAEITRMAQSGELLERSRAIDMDNLDPEDAEMLEAILRHEQDADGRTLQ